MIITGIALIIIIIVIRIIITAIIFVVDIAEGDLVF